MLVICLFDISCNKRRRKATRLLQGFGTRTQESVYECQISHGQLLRIQGKMQKIIAKTDRVHFYPLCGKDIGERKADGGGTVFWHEGFHVV